MIYFTSDLHFGHNREFIYKARGFKSIEEHDQTIVQKWNDTVEDTDVIYILGDLMLGDNEMGIQNLKQLKGYKYFIRGNHDTDNRLDMYIDADINYLGDADVIKYNGYHFYLSHYPTLTGNLEKESLKQMTCNLFGHTHQKQKFFYDLPYMYNVGVDAHDCYPVDIETIIKDMNQKVQECKNYL